MAKRVLSKNRKNYWAKKLISAGWIEDRGTHYWIKSIRTVWRSMGARRVVRRKTKLSAFHYTKYKLNNKQDYVKEVLQCLRQHLADRKVESIKNRLVNIGYPRKRVRYQEPDFSCTSAAYTLGYKSKSSGHKHRTTYFKVVRPTTLITEQHLGPDGGYYYKFPCFKIALL